VITVRPTGEPHARHLSLSAATRARLRGAARWLVVDEGPGLSGSSFGAAIEALRAAGVDERDIALTPSHDGPPGPAGSVQLQQRWRRLRRAPARTEAVLLGPRGLRTWIEDLVGPAVRPLEDHSAGNWRLGNAAVPVFAQQERRKFRLETAQGAYRLKFAGLGEIGERKLDRARHLADAGWSPRPLGLRHGFLVEPWLAGEPLKATSPPDLDWLGRYLGFRARHLPVGDLGGASPDDLQRMARRNLGLALGVDASERVCRAQFHPEFANDTAPRTVIDGRLQPWEWLSAGGRVLKSDAVDHAEAHDLIGCQPLEWDVAGAVVEFGLDAHQLGCLAEAAADAACRPVRPLYLQGYRLAYLAFQIGLWTYAAQSGAPEDRALASQRVTRLAVLAASDNGAATLGTGAGPEP
jgi:hypothetical protein